MDKGTIIRSIVLIIALANQLLMANGLTPIPGTEDVWGEVLATIFTVIAAGIAWFKNNYVTAKGQMQKEALQKDGLTKTE
ncbi:holin, SPP1 family [Terribacillus aidingensis]|uniref:Holin, SPP1 family n=1 Tax=Terribacillus aidingensis TaxID=586416 RepID=A0A285NLV3_9BACI|nr:phage holin [Terribacillus aidingensis]SNZ09903.1 holin, SPP1 family [Terribacillus aidingensis]